MLSEGPGYQKNEKTLTETKTLQSYPMYTDRDVRAP